MNKTINKNKKCKKHKKGGCAVCAAAILLGGKSKRKSLKKQKKMIGGAYTCGICQKQQRDTIPIVNLCGDNRCSGSNPICQGCAKEICRSGATPRFRHEAVRIPTCPFCRKDITTKCLEITGKKRIEQLVDWSTVPDINQIHTPQAALAAAQAAQLPPNLGVDGQGPMQIEELEPNPLTLHLHEDDIDDLHTIIEHMRVTITDGLSVSLVRDILQPPFLTPNEILTYLDTYQPNDTESDFTYDAYGINRTWTQHRINIQGNQANIHNFIQELKLLSITIRDRLIAGGYNAAERDQIRQDMLTYIFSQTMIGNNNEQSHWLVQILNQTLYPGDFASQNHYWQLINAILLRVMQYIETDISIIVTNGFTPNQHHGGKTKKSLKKRRKTRRKKNNKK
jgi:hypothetical protein